MHARGGVCARLPLLHSPWWLDDVGICDIRKELPRAWSRWGRLVRCSPEPASRGRARRSAMAIILLPSFESIFDVSKSVAPVSLTVNCNLLTLLIFAHEGNKLAIIFSLRLKFRYGGTAGQVVIGVAVQFVAGEGAPDVYSVGPLHAAAFVVAKPIEGLRKFLRGWRSSKVVRRWKRFV